MPFKVIVDTNVWVSYFINGRINYLIKWMLDHEAELINSEELIAEIEEVLHRPKFHLKRSKQDITDFLRLLREMTTLYQVDATFKSAPDVGDNFLFDLASQGNADYLITSDKKLLYFNPGFDLKIVSFSEFRTLLSDI